MTAPQLRVLAVTGHRRLSAQGPGGYKRQWYLIRGLERNGMAVTTWAIDPDPVDPISAAVDSPIVADLELPARPRRGLVRKLLALVSPLPEALWTRPVPAPPGGRSALAAYDIVVFLGSDGLQLLPWFRAAGTPIALDQYDVAARLMRSIAGTMPTRLARWRTRLDALKWTRLQSRAVAQAGLVVAVSDDDATVFQRHATGRVVVRPNGVDLDEYEFHDHAEASERRLLMTADFSYLPNIDATRWLTTDIWPRLREQLPAATLQLVGRGAPVTSLPAGISGASDVPHIQPFFDAADVFIVPLRSGGGTRLKVVEALAKGLPCVATAIACEGLAVQDGTHVLIGNTTGELVAAVQRVLADADLRRRLAANGRALVEQRYGWDQITDDYADDLRLLAGTAPA